jgi:hypothetical protein
MATRARIGIQQKSGRIIASYQHWDGYPGGLGYNLEEHWTDVKKVTDAIKLGNSSKWGQFIGGKIDFDDRNSETYDYQNVYYMRDRGEKDQGYRVYKNEAEYLAEGFNSGEEYIYLMKMDGKTDYMGRPIGTWYYSPYSNPEFKVLEEDAINDHIDMLKRHIEQMKKRQVA